MIAQVVMRDRPTIGVRPEGGGIGPANPGADDGLYRVVVREREVDHPDDPTLADLVEALVAVYDMDFGVHELAWISRFTDMSRQAASYRDRRVLLAGDAAHVHPPQGGQGLDIGVQMR